MTIKLIHPNWTAPPFIRAFTTQRVGGVSEGPYRSLNLADHVGDDLARVRENRKILTRSEFLPEEPVWLTQTHSKKVVDISRSIRATHDADGSYSSYPDVVCGVLTADCLPILVCDRKGEQVAALHAGWRGLLVGIVQQGIGMFKSRGEDLVVWLGPAIGPKMFEVGGEVREAFREQDPMNEIAFEAIPGTEKYLADIYQLARNILMGLGIPDYAIFGGEYCTYTQEEMFFSYRRDKGVTGRMVTVIFRTA